MHSEHALKGIHHITLVARSPQRTVQFYVQTLGLGFVKKTVNFDRPETYHLYFGDSVGTPGTLVTFFAWPDAGRGRIGVGSTHHFALTVESEEAQLKWKRRLEDAGVRVSGPYDRVAFKSIYFTDPDGVIVEIATRAPGWAATYNAEDVFVPPAELQRPARDERAIAANTYGEPVPYISEDMQLHGLHHISAMALDIEQTDQFYQEALSFNLLRKSVNFDSPSMPHWYWGVGDGAPGTIMTYFGMGDLGPQQRPVFGQVGWGTAHHIAFEVATDDGQAYWRDRLQEHGLEVTPILDREYFRSIYFTDPDGHILEIATTEPGFLVDQSADRLGRDLMLPPWLESHREALELDLSTITLDDAVAVS